MVGLRALAGSQQQKGSAQAKRNLGARLRKAEDCFIDKEQTSLRGFHRELFGRVRPAKQTRIRAPGGSFIWP